MSDILAEIMRAAELMKSLPPPPVFMSSIMFPADQAFRLTVGDAEHVCAAPSFWKQIPPASPGANINPLGRIEIVDLDAPNRHEQRSTICAAIVAASSRPKVTRRNPR